MDAIKLIKTDHQAVEELFKKYEATGPRARKAKKKLAERVVKELSVHAAMEEAVLYPRAHHEIDGIGDEVYEAYEEHRLIKFALANLAATPEDDVHLDARFKVLTEIVRHHVKEEERELLPTLRRLYTKAELEELGEQLAAAKAEAEDHPVLTLVETPLELVASGVAAFTSKAKEIGEDAITQLRDRVGSE